MWVEKGRWGGSEGERERERKEEVIVSFTRQNPLEKEAHAVYAF